ncbi:aminoglycoside phosphotransferase family protein [Thiomicrorhabdus sp. zzn3]|uniref:aminoglycoside phosphotransferase family protein n=1 Tax=Thiomicrorhabdus sp. zzn3 TaxID=3039775 RepID=UPI002436CB93|nr:aminoglycoside phosphotransferase family protein [Thiomicrorhabdus sp. zzn3]MDG6777252.1 aminoglycoside phosphotransferase family protein [Thiomicrorhabdus sp. zzn3]
MKTIPLLYEALRFLILDVQKQLQTLTDGLETQDVALLDKSLGRIDYIENTHVNLLNRAGQQYCQNDCDDDRVIIQSYEHISHSLKALSSQLQEMAYQLKKQNTLKLIQKKSVFNALNDLNKGLSLIIPAIESEHLTLSIDICRLQVRIDKTCSQQLEKYKKRLKTGQNTEALLHACFTLKDINLMGDALLRIGEGIISANLGQFIQIDRYHALEATLSALKEEVSSEELNIHSMGETKSGCTISGVRSSAESEDRILAIFKQGKKEKLLEEKASIESWHQKFPGIAPEVYSYQKQGDKAALLFEYLTGHTFDKLLLTEDRKTLKKALNTLFATLHDIWEQTRIDEVHPADFMKQLQKRLGHIYDVHPDFNLKGLQIGSVKQASLESIVKKAQKLEKKLSVPNAVYIHGDFNVDNIIYDVLQNQISFIDLHRSDYSDYVQDLSVLMVSFYRITNFEPIVCKRIIMAMEATFDFGARYAAEIEDKDYQLRMALGLARSFLTSTRFVLDKEHAKSMHFKGRYLIEQLLQLDSQQRQTYRIPKELFHD